MKKKILAILALFITFLTNVKAIDSTLKIYDFNQSLTINQENELKKRVNSYIEKNNIDMALITIKHYETKTVEEYTKEFFDKNSFGKNDDKSTIIFVLDYTDEPVLEIFTNGKADDIYNNIKKDEIKKSVNLNDSSYKVFNELIDEAEKCTGTYTSISKYVVFNKLSKNDYKIIALISFMISTSVMILLLLKSRKRKEKEAEHKKINLHMMKSVDKFINTHTEAFRAGSKK